MFGFKKLKKLLQKHEDEMNQVQPDVVTFDESVIRKVLRLRTFWQNASWNWLGKVGADRTWCALVGLRGLIAVAHSYHKKKMVIPLFSRFPTMYLH